MPYPNIISSGKNLLGIAIAAIGIIHLVTGHFPAGLLPVPATFPVLTIAVYTTGVLLTAAGILMLSPSLERTGALLAGIVFLVLLLTLHIPRLLMQLHNPLVWTPFAEVAALFSGTLLLWATGTGGGGNAFKEIPLSKAVAASKYLFAATLVIFGVQHFQYAGFIATLIPGWIPAHVFWAYLVMVAFFAAALAIVTRLQTFLATTLLALMFLLWFAVLHLPRVIAQPRTETEWTSLFVVLAMAGISLMLAGISTQPRLQQPYHIA